MGCWRKGVRGWSVGRWRWTLGGEEVERSVVELVRNLMAHGDAREGKWRGNWRMECVASPLTPPPNVVYPALLKLMRTPRLPAVDWTDAPTDLNGLVRFGESLKSCFCVCAITFRTSCDKVGVFCGGRGRERGLNSIFCHYFEWGGGTLCRIIFYVYFRTVLYVVNILLWSNVFVEKSSVLLLPYVKQGITQNFYYSNK